MTNYYTELEIDPASTVDEIKKHLTQEESKWMRREATNPEKAIKMRALIIEARKVFETSATKAKYDRELASSHKASKPNTAPNNQEAARQDFYNQALSYFDNKEYDLAKVAVDRALSHVNPNICNDALYSLAADIYYHCGDYKTALNYINRAIVDNRIPMHYILKAAIYRNMSLVNYDAEINYFAEYFKTLDTAISLANEIGSTAEAGIAYGLYALWFSQTANHDKLVVEQYARKAVQLGDSWGNGNKVLKQIELERQAERRKREEAELKRRQEEERRSAEEERRKSAEKALAEETARKAQKKKKITRIALSLTAITSIVIVLFVAVINPSIKYSKANSLLSAGDYDAAIREFENLNGYRNSEELIKTAQQQMLADDYDLATALYNDGDIWGAVDIYRSLGDYSDSQEKLTQLLAEEYQMADNLYNSKSYAEALEIFEKLGDYGDSEARCAFTEAEMLYGEGRIAAAAVAFSKLYDNEEALKRGAELWDIVTESRRKPVTVNKNQNDGSYVFGITSDGRVQVVLSGRNRHGQCNVSNWSNIVQVSADAYHTVGLKADGTVVAVGRSKSGQCDVSAWTDIKQVSAASDYTAGLCQDGTVITTDSRLNEAVSEWTNIVEISAATDHILGLKADGTVVAAAIDMYRNYDYVTDVTGWSDIVSIYASYELSVGLKTDGSIITIGSSNGFSRYWDSTLISDWKQLLACGGHANVVGLNPDGTIVQAVSSDNNFYFTQVSDWTDIVYISMGLHVITGVKSDGTIFVSGTNKYAFEGDIGELSNIRSVGKVY